MAELDDVTLDGRSLDSLRVTDLRTALEERGLPKSGQKNALLKRLKGALMLEDLQKHSSPHTGFQPNSQMGEEMGQNSFIKQYLEKQQELLRQRLQKEAREAAETEEQMVESEDEGLQTDIIPEHPESLHTVLKVPEVEQGKRTPKKCRLVLEEPEEFDEERPRKRERRSSRVKQAKIPKSPVLEKAVLESEQRRPSTRGRRSKGDAVLEKEEPEEAGEEEKETEEKEIKTTKDEDDLPKRRRLSTRAVTPLQHKRSPGVKQSPAPPELLEISSRSTSLETTDERVPPLLPIEEMKQQFPTEKQDKALSEKSGPPMPTEDAKVLRSPHKWRRQAREKAERGSELISHLHQEISVIQPTSNWRQESDKPKTKKHTSPLGEEKVSSPIGTKIGSTPKDVKGSPALVLIRPAVFGNLEGKRAAGSQSLHIVEKSAGRGVQAMSILEKQEPSPHSVVHEDNKSWSVPGHMSEIKSLTDLNKPGFKKSDMKPSLDVINIPESDNLHESSLVGSACTNKVKRLKSRTSVGASNQNESVTVKSRHISKRHNPCETEIPEVVKESPEVNQKKQLRSRSKKQKPNEKFSEPSKKKEKELTYANEVQNISGLERPVTKSVQSSEELMEVTQLDNLAATVTEQSKEKTVETQIENVEDSQFSDHCAPDPEITLEKVEQRHLGDHFTPAPEKTPEKVEERPLDDHRTPVTEIIKQKEEIYLDDHCIPDPQMLPKKVEQTHLSDRCRPAPKISKEMVEKSYVNFHCVPDPEKNVGNVEKAEDRFASFPESLHEKVEETELDDICADNVEESEKNSEETQLFDSCGTHVEESEENRLKTQLVDFCAPDVVKESEEKRKEAQLIDICAPDVEELEKFREEAQLMDIKAPNVGDVEIYPQETQSIETCAPDVEESEENREAKQLTNICAPDVEESEENREATQLTDICAPDVEESEENREVTQLTNICAPDVEESEENREATQLTNICAPDVEESEENREATKLTNICAPDVEESVENSEATQLTNICAPDMEETEDSREATQLTNICAPDVEESEENQEATQLTNICAPDVEESEEKREATQLTNICAPDVEESEENQEATQLTNICAPDVEESEKNREATQLPNICAPDVEESEENREATQLTNICAPDVEESEENREATQLTNICAPDVEESEEYREATQLTNICAPDVEESEENSEATQLTDICAPNVEESEENREATQLTNICAPDVEESEEIREATQLTNICAPDVKESGENREATQLTNICAPVVEESEERGKGTQLGGICAIVVEESAEKREEAQITFCSAPELEKREEHMDEEQLVNSCIPDLETFEEKVEERELSDQCKPDLEATEKRAEEVELYESVIISERSEKKIKLVDSCELNQEQSDLKAEVIQVNDNIEFLKEIATVHSEVTQPDGDYALIEESKEVASVSVMPANIVNDVILSVNQTSSLAEDETSMQLQKSPDSLSQEKDTLVIQETPDVAVQEMSSEQATNDHDSSNLVISPSTVVSDGAPKANVYDMPVDKTVIPYDTCADVVMTEEMNKTSVTPEQSLTAISGSQEAILSETADDGKCVEKEKHVEATEILQKSLSSMTPIITKEHDAQLKNILNTVNTNETTDEINQVFSSANRDSDFVSNVPEQLHLEDKVLSSEITHKTSVIIHDIAGLVTLEENNPAVVQETSKLIELVHDKPNESETAEHTLFRIPESKFKMCADESPMGIQETTETMMPKDMVSLTTNYQGEETSEIENALDKSITNIQKPSDLQGESVELEIPLEGSKLCVQKTHEVQKRDEPEASNKTPGGILEVELPAAEPVVSTVPDSKVMKPLGLSISHLQEVVVKEHFACPVFSPDGEVVTADSLIAIEEQQTLSTEAIEKSTERTPSGNPVDIPIKASPASILENVRGTNESNERKASETNGSFLSVAQTEEKLGTQHHDTTTEGSLVYPVTSEPLIIEDKKAAELMELQKSANEGNPEGLVRKLQRTRTSSSSSSSSTTSSSSSSSSSSNSSCSSSERSSHSRHSSRSRSSSVARHSRSSRSSSSSSSSRSSSSHSDKVDGSSVSTSLKNSPEPLSAQVQSPPVQDTLEPLPSTSPPLPSKPVSLQQNRTPPRDSSFHQDRGECRQTKTTLVNLTNQEHSKTMKIEPESEDQDQKNPASMEQKIGEETSPGDSKVAPEREDVVMEATDSQTESEPQEAAPAQPSEERSEGDDNKESTTPLRTFKRKISVISAKCSSQTSAASATNSDGEGAHPARRRRWGASTAATQKKPSISISTESLKSLIPEIKEIKQEAIVDLHADDTHISEDESERNGDENSHDKGLKICRTVTQVVPAEVQENGQDGEEEAAEAAVPEPDPIPMETDVVVVVAAQQPIEQQEDKKPLADSPARAEVRVTLGDTLLRRSISQQKTGVSVTIDDPVRTASQLPSPPRRKISCIVHICNLVRPFTLGQLKELLSRTGTLIEEHFWIDKIKSHCYVTYPTVEEAVATRNSLHGVKWPQSNPKFLSVDFAEQDELDFHRGLLTERPPEPKQEEPPRSHMPAPRGEHRDHDRGVREQWAEREREMERRERTRSEREWDRDKIREDPRSRSRDRRCKEHAKSKEKKNEKKEKVQEEPPAKLLDDLFHKTKAAPCIYWLPLTEDQVLKKVADRAERAKEREKRRKEQEEQEEEERKERAKEREKEMDRSRERTREAEKRREHSREHPRERDRREQKRHSRSRSRSTPVRDRGGRR
ncbi:apoptotic chromatin condensation inducer in the nucleus isoform X2 [Bombina bombina]|uniref:apoptotic chromatin condensation inducer in the nucleus isoform X2 n=1 Tax=Bombina bombina TaxID=8345 RepID=UPI00235ACF9C|nr:apoptotic chromatin condensation inducer in the nucleus isoform X2 [Bombina bombina]